MRGIVTVAGRGALASFLALVACVWASTASAQPASSVSGEVMTRVSASVVQLRARGCDGQDRVGTGFVWPAADRVVTAMHVVTGCRQLSVYHEQRRIERDASIIGVLKAADLALLAVRGAGELPVLTADPRQPAAQEELAVLGYELGVPTMGSKTLRLSFGASRLRDMVPDRVRGELQNIGFPSLDLEILRLEGHLLPGHSGAPIFDRQGRVVAIGSGGLENGAASISWAVPTAQLDRLRNSSERLPTAGGRQVASLFAASLESRAQGSVRCGEITFTKMRTRSFGEIARSTDSPMGLQQILQAFAYAGLPDMTSLLFDIYVDRDSGGTVVVPSGTALRAQGPVCLAQSTSGSIRMYIRGDTLRAAPNIGVASANFVQFLVNDTQLYYQVDPNWTYVAPDLRFDGLLVNRRAAVGYDAMRMVRGYVFETLMTRGHTFIGVAAVNWRLNQEMQQTMQFCQLQPTAPVCSQLRAITLDWAPFVLAIHMSTFPVG